MRQQPRRHEKSEALLSVMNRHRPQQYAIFEQEECCANAKGHAECRGKQGHLDVMTNQLRREGCFDLCGVQAYVWSLLLLLHAFTRIAQIICWKQDVHRGGIIVHCESTECATQYGNQHRKREISAVPPKSFGKRCEYS